MNGVINHGSKSDYRSIIHITHRMCFELKISFHNKSSLLPPFQVTKKNLLLQVNQSYLVVPHEQNFQMVLHLLKEHISQVVDYKV